MIVAIRLWMHHHGVINTFVCHATEIIRQRVGRKHPCRGCIDCLWMKRVARGVLAEQVGVPFDNHAVHF